VQQVLQQPSKPGMYTAMHGSTLGAHLLEPVPVPPTPGPPPSIFFMSAADKRRPKFAICLFIFLAAFSKKAINLLVKKRLRSPLLYPDAIKFGTINMKDRIWTNKKKAGWVFLPV
jgi:hypothetical protein